MKKVLFYAFGISLFLATASCADDDNAFSSSPSEISSTITSGTWKIASFTENGADVTAGFSSYTFTFTAPNTITAVNTDNTFTGTWTVEEESGDDNSSSNNIDFIILFNQPVFFAKLSEDWNIMERSSSKLKLKHVSGGDGGTDYLTFGKK